MFTAGKHGSSRYHPSSCAEHLLVLGFGTQDLYLRMTSSRGRLSSSDQRIRHLSVNEYIIICLLSAHCPMRLQDGGVFAAKLTFVSS
jgi:hypothetical protein